MRMVERFILKYRDKCGFDVDELTKIQKDPHLNVIEVFLNRAVLLESSENSEKIAERHGDKWIVGLEVVYQHPENKD